MKRAVESLFSECKKSPRDNAISRSRGRPKSINCQDGATCAEPNSIGPPIALLASFDCVLELMRATFIKQGLR